MTLRRLFPLLLALGLFAAGCKGGDSPPNIVIIAVDALRTDRLGCYGFPGRTSPMIDFLARKGARFQNAYTTAPWGLPAYGSLLTGAYPSDHGVLETGQFIRSDLPLVSEHINRAGYLTAGFVANPALKKARGFGRGFDHYFFLTSPRKGS